MIIKHISIKNFKGIADYERDFDAITNEIVGRNGSGKTTIKNAYEWVLCQNVSGVIPMLNNKEIPNLETSVELTIDINGVEYKLKRTMKGKYNGKNKISNESVYTIDGIELGAKQYLEKVAGTITGQDPIVLKMLTDKDFFNTDTTQWKWTDRRKLLLAMCGTDSTTNQLLNKPEYAVIKDYIVKGYATSDIKSMLRKEKSALTTQQQKNLTLIEHNNNEIAEYSTINFDDAKKELASLEKKLTKLQTQSKKENQTEQLELLQNRLYGYTQELTKLQTADTLELSRLRTQKDLLYNQCRELYSQIANVGNETTCPYCHRELPKEMLEETSGKTAELKAKYEELKAEHNDLTAQVDNFEPNPQIKELNYAIERTKTDLEQAKATNLNNLSLEEQTTVKTQISSLQETLAKEQFITKAKAQIELWQKDSRRCADEIIKVEEKEIALDKFVQEQTDLISKSVNDNFTNGISWSLYNETYKNGEGGIEEDCVCMYNGRRYENLSNGEKNIANIETTKALQKYFGVVVPIWVDNREVISIDINITDQQVITLSVDAVKTIDKLTKLGE